MKKFTPRMVAETVGLVCVVGSLIFVGLEQRQNTIAIRAATNSSFASGFQELNLVVASSPSLSKALAQLDGNLDDISQEDRIQILGLYRALFHIWSNGHRQFLNGTLDPVLYDGVIQEISTYARKASSDTLIDSDRRRIAMKWAWKSEKFIYNPEFQQLMDSILGDE
jgi:hypothetical protein